MCYRILVEPDNVHDLEHALVFILLNVLPIKEENYALCALIFGEVTEVHKGVLCEGCEYSVAKPYVEREILFVLRIENAGVSA